MIEKKHFDIPLLHFNNLNKFQDISHFVSTREGGVSTEHLSSFNLGFTVNDKPENVLKNREILAEATDIILSRFIFAKQSSEDKVVSITEKHLHKDKINVHSDLIGVDAMITNKKGLCLTILTADCVPVLLYDSVKKVIGISHAGWRGTALNITQKTAQQMHKEFACKYEDLVVGIGPSIGPSTYEVGTEVINEFQKNIVYHEKILKPAPNEKAMLNLWKANKIQLMELGVKENNIEIAEICTYSESGKFFSARKTKGKTGRFATGIILI
ncbi:MAG TPA: peptidoglycan editing factor PgeF [Bacteroidales bacterium]|nr:MAG: hypothetical protein A2W98_05690 [Bacteroidetes bacterium GWF2_33_38]OFY74932.1 MAG: hypothetical protein A2265_10660 [Bacteroidetes bacterium RIFOXYA12_FULL_33_9]OFY90843.1 MAG: hypothetical protein A2236_06470 [Bacteroidetes bacterium RIFOXYA2_FULL_33_7]HBF89491.1 peptidoglycan editing factor PgeF [Bacteroidales bacterium]